jgi:hypothetical protein
MTRSNMRELGLDVPPTLLREELARIKAAGSEVVLIDPQYAPRVPSQAPRRRHGFARRHDGEGGERAPLPPLRADAPLVRPSTCRSRPSSPPTGCT